MLNILKNKKHFALLFFTVLLIDLIVKTNLPIWPYRYISKPPILLLLVLYYYYNNTDKALNPRNYMWTMISFIFFCIGDFTVLTNTNVYFLGTTLVSFTLAKIFLCFRFSHKQDFKVGRLIIFSVFIFLYTLGLTAYLYDALGDFFLPTLISYFTSLLLCQFAFLRKGVVNIKSYLSVFYGTVLLIVSEGILVIITFKEGLPFQDITVMLFYSTGFYLIIHGIIIAKRIPSDNSF